MKWIQLLMISWSVFRLCPCTLIMVYPITHQNKHWPIG
jgi:hypothetical protein